MESVNKRPFGILVLGAISIAIAIVRLLVGLQLLGVGIFGDEQLDGSGVVWVGIMLLVVGAIYLAVGWALWSMRTWALLFTMIMAIVGLVDALLVLLSSGNLVYAIAAAILPAFLLWYTRRPDIRAAFAAVDRAEAEENIRGQY